MTDSPRKRPAGLGRGLSSLLGEVQQESPVRLDARAAARTSLASISESRGGSPFASSTPIFMKPGRTLVSSMPFSHSLTQRALSWSALSS